MASRCRGRPADDADLSNQPCLHDDGNRVITYTSADEAHPWRHFRLQEELLDLGDADGSRTDISAVPNSAGNPKRDIQWLRSRTRLYGPARCLRWALSVVGVHMSRRVALDDDNLRRLAGPGSGLERASVQNNRTAKKEASTRQFVRSKLPNVRITSIRSDEPAREYAPTE